MLLFQIVANQRKYAEKINLKLRKNSIRLYRLGYNAHPEKLRSGSPRELAYLKEELRGLQLYRELQIIKRELQDCLTNYDKFNYYYNLKAWLSHRNKFDNFLEDELFSAFSVIDSDDPEYEELKNECWMRLYREAGRHDDGIRPFTEKDRWTQVPTLQSLAAFTVGTKGKIEEFCKLPDSGRLFVLKTITLHPEYSCDDDSRLPPIEEYTMPSLLFGCRHTTPNL